MANKNKVVVKILGQEYTLVSEDDREYMQKIANYVDDRMEDISKGNKKFSTAMTAVLTALNIADDFMRLNDVIKEKDNEIAKVQEVVASKDNAIEELNQRLERKIAEYEDLFDKFKINASLEKDQPLVDDGESEILREELYKREDELLEAKNLIQEFRVELDKSKSELDDTKSELQEARSELTQFIEEFDGN
ncbi:MAG: cell division protein ZapA [Firmicutes bacterium]|jgi:cell division protein ZapA|nr:cell division protein ZapA [Bacillota bacterium]